MRRPLRTLARCAAALLTLLVACSEDPRPPLTLSYSTPPDASDAADAEPDLVEEPDPLPRPGLACEAGAIRCLATATPDIERCEVLETTPAPTPDDPDAAQPPPVPAVTRWRQAVCPEGEVCQSGACAPFACEPGRPACLGIDRAGVCNAAGDALDEEAPCEGHTTCRGGQCVDPCEVAAASRSYIGCDYLVVRLANPLIRESGSLRSPFGIAVANDDPLQPALIQLTEPDGTTVLLTDEVRVEAQDLEGRDHLITVRSAVRTLDGEVIPLRGEALGIELPPGAVATLLLPEAELPAQASAIAPLARRLRSTRPVVAYQFNPYCCNLTFTNDATLLLPVTALGQRYTTIGAPDMPFTADVFGAFEAVVVAAPYDGTVVEVTLPPGSRLKASITPQRLTLPEPSRAEPRQLRLALDGGEVLTLTSDSSAAFTSVLSGTTISASQPVATFSTHECTYVPQDLPACDHIEQQLIPEDTWGQRYVAAPTRRRGANPDEVIYWHLVAGEEGATVRFGTPFTALGSRPPLAPTLPSCRGLLVGDNADTLALAPRGHCMFGTNEAVVLDADRPIMILGTLVGEVASTTRGQLGTGDPAVFLLPPVEQFRQRYLFITPETYAFDYATLILPLEGASTLTLDGEPLDLHRPDILVTPVPASGMIVAHVPVTDGAHRVESNAAFGLIVYAYDQFVSYAYPGGLNLSKRR